MAREKSTVESALTRKGFRTREGDHTFYCYHSIAGKKTPVITKVSHGAKMKVIPDNILALMAKQCKLSKNQFNDLIDCPMDQKKYEDILKSNEYHIDSSSCRVAKQLGYDM